jgi:Tfp pilus assembly protein PilV
MTANNTYGHVRSALGEHLIALLVIAIVILGLLTAYPALASETRGTAGRAQERVNMPLLIASQLDDQSASPDSP